ncbi:hypothetical protein FQA39_LY17113 [Lamprigera yunnana]|nr:hypothetical protein FQA39_LY17113 [Lamprigera yunnana]
MKMAWISKDARDVPPDYSTHHCHPKTLIKTVSCIVCDLCFCKSEFNNKVVRGMGFYVSNHLVCCEVHPNLTFDSLLSADNELDVNLENVNIDAVEPEEIERLLINRKFSLMQKAKESLDDGLNLTQGIISDRMDRENVDDDDDLQSIASDRSAGIERKRFGKNITDCKDCQRFCVELNCKKQLHRELMKHNEQLREHNKLLRCLVKKKKTMVVESFKLAINPAKNYKGDLLKTVKSQVSTKTKAKIIKIDKVKNGAIHIKCDSVNNKEVITNILNKENKDILWIKAFVKNNPQIKIVNITNEVKKEELTKDIIE